MPACVLILYRSLRAVEIDHEFHARFSCVARHYEYVIVNRRSPLALDRGLGVAGLALSSMPMRCMSAAQRLVGRHDFTTFRSAHCQAESPIRTLDRLDVSRDGERILIHASARSFLHHQVRSMTGCLSPWSERANGPPTDLAERRIDGAKDRAALGFNAPPDGLYFVSGRITDRSAISQRRPMTEE